jgi:hypothetical protein
MLRVAIHRLDLRLARIACTSPPEYLVVGRPSLTEQARAIGARTERCSFRGTALTASSRRTGVGLRHTWTIMFVAEYRC